MIVARLADRFARRLVARQGVPPGWLLLTPRGECYFEGTFPAAAGGALLVGRAPVCVPVLLAGLGCVDGRVDLEVRVHLCPADRDGTRLYESLRPRLGMGRLGTGYLRRILQRALPRSLARCVHDRAGDSFLPGGDVQLERLVRLEAGQVLEPAGFTVLASTVVGRVR